MQIQRREIGVILAKAALIAATVYLLNQQGIIAFDGSTTSPLTAFVVTFLIFILFFLGDGFAFWLKSKRKRQGTAPQNKKTIH